MHRHIYTTLTYYDSHPVKLKLKVWHLILWILICMIPIINLIVLLCWVLWCLVDDCVHFYWLDKPNWLKDTIRFLNKEL